MAAILVFRQGIPLWKWRMTRTSLALVSLCACLVACAPDQQTATRTPGHSAAVHKNKEAQFIQPRVGMTKDQVLNAYGKPDSILHTSKGEIWRYWFNRGATIWLGSRPRLASLLFNEKGTVKEYLWNE
jgi:outer membrane protein assembly factor BamE (lipoprotein component of BamABCDE complex)